MIIFDFLLLLCMLEFGILIDTPYHGTPFSITCTQFFITDLHDWNLLILLPTHIMDFNIFFFYLSYGFCFNNSSNFLLTFCPFIFIGLLTFSSHMSPQLIYILTIFGCILNYYGCPSCYCLDLEHLLICVCI